MKHFYFFILILAGCQTSPKEDSNKMRIVSYSELKAPPASFSVAAAPAMRQSPQTNTTIPTSRMVIMNANLDLEIENYDQAMDQIKSITQKSHGFIVHSARTEGSIKSGE